MLTRRTWRRGGACALCSLMLLVAPLRAAEDQPPVESPVPAPSLRALDETRRLTGCLVAPTDEIWRDLEFLGRESIEIKGRERGGSGAMRDLAIYNPGAGRIVSYVCFTNASTRRSGEAIVSLAEISSRGDKLVRAVLPGSKLELEGVRRHRPGESESVYYEAFYAAVSGEFPFFDPPVRLLLNASTGSLFRLDIDPDWLDPPAPPRVRISRKAAERIATVVLQRRELAPAFGAGAVLGAVTAGEMFTVHPNDWLGFFKEPAAARARLAWVVPFRVNGGAAAGPHSIFVDAAAGLVLGGQSVPPALSPPR